MELGKLRGAIRKAKGNPNVLVRLGDVTLTLQPVKGVLLEELGARFPDGGETGLIFDVEANELRSTLTVVKHVELPETATSVEVAEAFAGVKEDLLGDDDLLGEDEPAPADDDDLLI